MMIHPIICEDIDNIVERVNGWDKLKGRTILCAGAGSLIGGYTAMAMSRAGQRYGLGLKIVCLVRTLSKAAERFAEFIADPGFSLIETDLGYSLNYDGDADIIIHSGGSSSPWAYANDPVGILRSNVAGALDLLELAKKRKSEAILFFSTREVYGNPAGTKPIREEDLGPMDHMITRNIYPECKKLTESALAAYGAQHGIPWYIYRIASVYGPDMKLANDGRAISDFVRAAISGDDIVLTGDGRAVRSYCYITDCVCGILDGLLSGERNMVYNLANETMQLSIKETAELALEVGGAGSLRFAGAAPIRAEGKSAPQYSSFAYAPMDTGRLEALGWEPVIGLREGLERTIAFFRI